MTSSPLHSVSVAGVVLDNLERVLVIKRRDNGSWQIPGGILEIDETFEDGVVREVLEETGVQVNVGLLTGVYKNMTASVVALVYRCTALSTSVRSSDEAAEVRWLRPAQAIELMEETFGIRVRDALDSTCAASRAHDGKHLL